MGAARQGLRRGCAACALLALPWAVPAQAQEYIRVQEPVPESVEQLEGPIGVAFPEPEPAPTPS